MIGQYLSNTNESATVSISQKFSELNKAKVRWIYITAMTEIGHRTRIDRRALSAIANLSYNYISLSMLN